MATAYHVGKAGGNRRKGESMNTLAVLKNLESGLALLQADLEELALTPNDRPWLTASNCLSLTREALAQWERRR